VQVIMQTSSWLLLKSVYISANNYNY